MTAQIPAGVGSGELVALPRGVPHLVCELAGTPCLLPLAHLRGVVRELAALARFPFAPNWLLGVFPYRTEVLALVDPVPFVFGREASVAAPSYGSPSAMRAVTTALPAALDGPCAVIVGGGNRSLALRLDRAQAVVFVPEATVSAPSWDRFEEVAATGVVGRYLAGAWTPEPGAASHAILAIERVLADLLERLEEDADG
jgi:chemotaxis signal transduction protein